MGQGQAKEGWEVLTLGVQYRRQEFVLGERDGGEGEGTTTWRGLMEMQRC